MAKQKDLLNPNTQIDPKTGLVGLDPDLNFPIYGDISTSQFKSLESRPTEGFEKDEFSGYFPDQPIVTGEFTSLEDERAKRQSASEIWGRSVRNMGLYAGTTFLDNIVGTVVGLGNLAATGEWNKFHDNPFTQEMLRIQKEWEAPIYRTREEEADPWSGVVPFSEGSSKFWGDMVLKNFGFTLGSVAAGIVSGSAVMGLSKLAIGKAAKGLIGMTTKGGTEIKNITQGLKAIQSGELSAANLTDDLVRAAKQLKSATTRSQIAGAVFGSQAESRFEAVTAMNDFKEKELSKLDEEFTNVINDPRSYDMVGSPETGWHQELKPEIKERYEKRKKDIEDAAEGVANWTWGLNMAILSASNLAQFRKAFAGGFRTERKLKNVVGNIKDGYKVVEEGKLLGGIKKTAKGLQNVLTEGEEEQLQEFASTGSKSFYGRQIDPNAGSTVDNFINGFTDGAKEAWGTANGWQQFFVGGVTGMAGVPTIGTRKSGKTGLVWAGGAMDNIREMMQESAEGKKAVETLNNVVKSKEFKNMYSGAIRHASYENDKQEALERDDPFGYKNADYNQLVNSVVTFDKAGKLDDLIDHFKGMKSASEEELRKIFPHLKDERSDKIKEFINQRSDKLVKQVERIADLKEAINIQFPQAPIKVQEELLHYASTMNDADERMNEIESELSVFAGRDQLKTAEGRKEVKKKIDEFTGPEQKDYQQKLKDYPKLLDRKQKFVELYKKYSKPDEVEKLDEKLTKEQTKAEEKAVNDAVAEKVGKVVTDENGVTNRVDQDANGKIYITPIDDNGNAKGPTVESSADKVVNSNVTATPEITTFAKRLISGEELSSPEDLQFYENNKASIETELQRLYEESQTVIEETSTTPVVDQSTEPVEETPEETTPEETESQSDQNPQPTTNKETNKFKRSIHNLYRRLVGNQMDPSVPDRSTERLPGEDYLPLNPDASQRRYFRFVTGNKVKGKLIRFFTMDQFFGDVKKDFLANLAKNYAKNGRNFDPKWFDNAVIGAVTDKDGKFVDVEGNALADQTLDSVRRNGVFTFLSEANPKRKSGIKKYHIPAGMTAEQAAEAAEAETKLFKEQRDKLIENLKAGKTIVATITGKGGGVWNYIDSNDFPTAVNKVEGSHLEISREGSATTNQIDSVKGFDPGEIILVDANDNVLKVERSPISLSDANLISDLIIALFRNNYFRVEKNPQKRDDIHFAYFRDKSGNEIQINPIKILQAYIPFLKQPADKAASEIFFANTPKGRSSLKLNFHGNIITILNSDGSVNIDAKRSLMEQLTLGSLYNVSENVLKGKDKFISVNTVDTDRGIIEYEEKDSDGYMEYLGSVTDGKPRLYTNVAVGYKSETNSFDPITGNEETAEEERTPVLNMQLEFDYNDLKEVVPVKERRKFKRLAGKSVKKEDIPAAIEWFKERFPNIDVKVIQGLIESNSWGMVYDAAVYLSSEAEIGTTYHEAWHIVTSVFLTERERQKLYREYRKVSKNYTYTDDQVEEALADEYMNYKLGIPSKFATKGTIGERFFRKLMQFINWITGRPTSDVRAIFEKIDSGYYKSKPRVSISNKKFKKIKSVKGDYAFTRAAVKAINVYFFQHFFGEGATKEAFDSLFSPESNAKHFTEAYETVKKFIQNEIDTATDENVKKNFQAILDNFDDYKEFHKTELLRHNLEVIEDEVSEFDRQRDGAKNWFDSSIKASIKSTASNRMRLILGTIPKESENEYGFPELEEFGTVFGAVVNNLAGSLTLDEMKVRLGRLAIQMPVVKKLIDRLHLNDDKELSSEEMSNLSDFVNTFSKNFYNYLVTVVGKGGKALIVDTITSGLRDRIITTWSSNVHKVRGNESTKKYYSESKGILVYNKTAFEGRVVNSWESAKRFYSILGIEFKNPGELLGKEAELTDLAKKLLLKIQSTDKMPIIFEYNADSGVKGYLNSIIEIEQSTRVNDFENSHFNLDGERVYNVGLNSYVTEVINTINNAETMEDLIKELPWLNPANENYVRTSEILKKVFGKEKLKIQFGILEGNREEHHQDAEEFQKLSFTDKLATKINFIRSGRYFMLRPGDNKQEKWFSFGGKFFSNADVYNNKVHVPLLIDYLKDELSRTIKILNEGTEIAFKKQNAKNGILLSVIDAYGSPALKSNLEAFYKDQKELSADQWVDNNKHLIQNAVNDFVNNRTDDLAKALVSNKIVTKKPDGTYLNNGLNVGLAGLTEAQLKSVAMDAYVNNFIASIEQTKLFYGDPISYKTIVDEFKRHESANSTRKHLMVDDLMNTWLEKNYERTDGKTVSNTNYEGHPVVITATLQDITVKSKNIEKLAKSLKSALKVKKYEELNEADAQGIISMDEYREMMIRSSAWNEDMEALWQHEVNGAEKPKSKVKFVPLKLVEYGPLAEDGYNQTLYKLSVYPLVPSMIKGRNLSTVAETMKNGKIGIVTFNSGNKFGYKTVDGNKTAQSAYNEDGSVNTNLKTQTTYYKNWGIQLDIAPKSKMSVPLGTQMMKHVFNGVFNLGIARAGTQETIYELREVNAKRIAIGVEQLRNKLGLKLVNEFYQVDNLKELKVTLINEANKRQLPDNVIEQIENLDEGTGIDVLIAREKIEQYLMALADSMTTSQKVFGNSAIQMSSAFFEELGFKRTKKDGVYSSSDLKFYELEENGKKVSRMEVYIPNYWNGRIKSGDDLLKLVGFRIPTQGMNSIESIVVKGFLPSTCSEMIVLPSEIVGKSGGDFDVDKMILYFPNFFVNSKTKKLEKISLENVEEQWKNYEGSSETDLLSAIFKTNLEDESGMSKSEFIKKALENRMYELQSKLILDPDNYENLITPNSTDLLLSAAARITWIREGRPDVKNIEQWYKNFIETKDYYNIADLQYQMMIAERFQGGVAATGPTALMSTFLMAAQEHNLYINDTLPFDHNRTSTASMVDGIALGAQLNVSKERISDLVSQWIDLSVDSAKEPHMSMSRVGMHNLPIVLYLTAAGVDKNVINAFMSQPIVLKYYREREIFESQIAEENFDFKDRNKDAIIAGIRKLYSKTGTIEKNDTPFFTQEQLESMVKGDLTPVATLTDEERAIQLSVLDHLLHFEEVAKELSLAVRTFGFDTGAGGKNIVQLLLKQRNVARVLKNNVIKNYDVALGVKKNGTPDEKSTSFMAPYYRAVFELNGMLMPFTKFLSHPLLFEALSLYIDDQIRTHKGNIDKILKNATMFRQDFFTWLFTTQKFTINGVVFDIQKDKEELFYGENNITVQLEEAKKRHPNNYLLQNLIGITPHTKYIFGTVDYAEQQGQMVPIDKTGVRTPFNIKFIGKDDDALDVNSLVGAWEELLQDPIGLQLVKVALTQTGFQNSPMSFHSLIPAEISDKIMRQLIAKINIINESPEAPIISRYMQQYEWNNPNTLPKTRDNENPGNVRKKRYLKVDGKRSSKNAKSKFPIIVDTATNEEVPDKYLSITLYNQSIALKNYTNELVDMNVNDDSNEVAEKLQDEGQLTGVEPKTIPQLRTFADRISEGRNQIMQGLFDPQLKKLGMTREQMISELFKTKNDKELSDLLRKKLCK